jgi:hypothetical protein
MEYYVHNKHLIITKQNISTLHAVLNLAFLLELLESSIAMYQQMLGGKVFLSLPTGHIFL